MTLDDYVAHDGIGLAALIAKTEVKPEHLAAMALDAAKRLQPTLNALAALYPERASVDRAAELGHGPFRGVPFLVKDLVLHEAGRPVGQGSRLAEGGVYPHHSDLMQRFIDAGFNTIGRTTSPEFGLSCTTENRLNGPTRNPWNVTLMPGGSSGGAAVCVAAGVVPIAHANDAGGSIRTPASCCGVFGLKPSRMRNPVGPDVGTALFDIATENVVSRSVRDTAAVLDAINGPALGDPYAIPAPERPYLDEIRRSPGRLRIAFTGIAPGPITDPEIAAATLEAARLCEALGHDVFEAAPEWRFEEMIETYMRLTSVSTAGAIEAAARLTGRTPSPDNLEAGIWAFYTYGKTLSATDFASAFGRLNRITRSMARFFEDCDVLLTPTNARLPQPLGTYDMDRAGIGAEEWLRHIRSFTGGFPAFFNLTGQPAMSVPLCWSADGIPIGMQFAGRFGDEATLLRLAAQLEAAHPWAHRRPPVHALSALPLTA